MLEAKRSGDYRADECLRDTEAWQRQQVDQVLRRAAMLEQVSGCCVACTVVRF